MPTDIEKLQGTWTVTSLEVDGQKFPSSGLEESRIIIKKNKFQSVAMGATYEGTVEINEKTTPKVMLKASFTLDNSKTPHAIGYLNLAGSANGKAQSGIYELNGKTLKICMSAPGKPRPADFSSKRGDGRSFTAWRFVKR